MVFAWEDAIICCRSFCFSGLIICFFTCCFAFNLQWHSFQEILGAIPEGYEGYFRSRFPKLLIEIYKVMSIYCREDNEIKKYFEI